MSDLERLQQPWKTSCRSLSPDFATAGTEEWQEETLQSGGRFPLDDTPMSNTAVLPGTEETLPNIKENEASTDPNIKVGAHQ